MLVRLVDRIRSWRAGFGARHFRRRERYRDDYLRFASALVRMLQFDSVIDIGCANGFLLEGFLAAGKSAAGVERSPAVRSVLSPQLASRVRIGDFSAADGRWDLVCCVEVAEHIPPDRSEELVETLARLATRRICFTAAPPGQGGRGHINCRPLADWQRWFEARGWRTDDDTTATLRGELRTLREAPWLADNALVLEPAPSADLTAGRRL